MIVSKAFYRLTLTVMWVFHAVVLTISLTIFATAAVHRGRYLGYYEAVLLPERNVGWATTNAFVMAGVGLMVPLMFALVFVVAPRTSLGMKMLDQRASLDQGGAVADSRGQASEPQGHGTRLPSDCDCDCGGGNDGSGREGGLRKPVRCAFLNSKPHSSDSHTGGKHVDSDAFEGDVDCRKGTPLQNINVDTNGIAPSSMSCFDFHQRYRGSQKRNSNSKAAASSASDPQHHDRSAPGPRSSLASLSGNGLPRLWAPLTPASTPKATTDLTTVSTNATMTNAVCGASSSSHLQRETSSEQSRLGTRRGPCRSSPLADSDYAHLLLNSSIGERNAKADSVSNNSHLGNLDRTNHSNSCSSAMVSSQSGGGSTKVLDHLTPMGDAVGDFITADTEPGNYSHADGRANPFSHCPSPPSQRDSRQGSYHKQMPTSLRRGFSEPALSAPYQGTSQSGTAGSEGRLENSVTLVGPTALACSDGDTHEEGSLSIPPADAAAAVHSSRQSDVPQSRRDSVDGGQSGHSCGSPAVERELKNAVLSLSALSLPQSPSRSSNVPRRLTTFKGIAAAGPPPSSAQPSPATCSLGTTMAVDEGVCLVCDGGSCSNELSVPGAWNTNQQLSTSGKWSRECMTYVNLKFVRTPPSALWQADAIELNEMRCRRAAGHGGNVSAVQPPSPHSSRDARPLVIGGDTGEVAGGLFDASDIGARQQHPQQPKSSTLVPPPLEGMECMAASPDTQQQASLVELAAHEKWFAEETEYEAIPTRCLLSFTYFIVAILSLVMTLIYGFTAGLETLMMSFGGNTISAAQGWDMMFKLQMVTPNINRAMCEAQLKGECSGGRQLCNEADYLNVSTAHQSRCPYCPLTQPTIATFTRTCPEAYVIPVAHYGIAYLILMAVNVTSIVGSFVFVAVTHLSLGLRMGNTYEENVTRVRVEAAKEHARQHAKYEKKALLHSGNHSENTQDDQTMLLLGHNRSVSTLPRLAAGDATSTGAGFSVREGGVILPSFLRLPEPRPSCQSTPSTNTIAAGNEDRNGQRILASSQVPSPSMLRVLGINHSESVSDCTHQVCVLPPCGNEEIPEVPLCSSQTCKNSTGEEDSVCSFVVACAHEERDVPTDRSQHSASAPIVNESIDQRHHGSPHHHRVHPPLPHSPLHDSDASREESHTTSETIALDRSMDSTRSRANPLAPHL